MKKIFDILNPWRGNKKIAGGYLSREILLKLKAHLNKKEITVLLGPRQVGKTVLTKMLINHLLKDKKINPLNIFYFNMDESLFFEIFHNISDFVSFISRNSQAGKKYIFIDEVQRLPQADLWLKKIYDLQQDYKIIITGSSSLSIKSKIKESLAGRKRVFEIWPFSWQEFLSVKNFSFDDWKKLTAYEQKEVEKLFEQYLIYGGYPAVIKEKKTEEKKEMLREIVSSYVNKDIVDFLQIEDVAGFNNLNTILASQIGNLLNIEEICNTLKIKRLVAVKYLEVLQGTYINFLLPPYVSNKRKEITKAKKIYNIDLGVRNYLINNFNPLSSRTDTGAMVENFVFNFLRQSFEPLNLFYWRTTNQTEIDFIIKDGLQISPLEVKYSRFKNPVLIKSLKSFVTQTKNINKVYLVNKNLTMKKQFDGLTIDFINVMEIFKLLKK